MTFCVSFDVGTKNLAFVVMCQATQQIVDWDVVTVPNTSLVKLVAYLESLFNDPAKTYQVSTIDTVLIEKQPSRNTKMRVMENTLHIFFLVYKIPRVVAFSAKNKLGAIGKTVTGKSNYTLRKKYSVLMCRKFLEEFESEQWQARFESHAKKDDLADCVLQYLAYAQPKRIESLSSIVCTL
jgi:hypothetical protein